MGRKRAASRVAVGALALTAAGIGLANLPRVFGDEDEPTAGITLPRPDAPPKVVVSRAPRPAPPPGLDLGPEVAPPSASTGLAELVGESALVGDDGTTAPPGSQGPKPRPPAPSPRR